MMRGLMLTVLLPAALVAQRPDTGALRAEIAQRAAVVLPKVVAWRRDIHEHPELSYQEVRTAKLVADHLRALGLEVRDHLGGNGVVGVLKGGRPGGVVALRADMDALPVTEQVELPFKSTVRTTYNGQDVGVMHACGHDMHTAMLMGAAEVLAGMKSQLAGTVLFLFQPAEEAPPDGGAKGMIEAGAVSNPVPDAVFMLHTTVRPVGSLYITPGPSLAAGDNFRIVIRGKQRGYIKAQIEKPKDKAIPSYINSSGSWSLKYGLFPYDFATQMMKAKELSTLVLVEGPRDALRLLKYGIPAMCIMGTQSWGAAKLRLLEFTSATRIVLMMDGDLAGRKATRMISTGLDVNGNQIAPPIASSFLVKTVRLWNADEPGLDPGNCQLDILRSVRRLLV